MELATDAEKAMIVSEFLDFKRRNKVQFHFTGYKIIYFIRSSMNFASNFKFLMVNKNSHGLHWFTKENGFLPTTRDLSH